MSGELLSFWWSSHCNSSLGAANKSFLWYFVAKPHTPCPKDWEEHEDQCYFFNGLATSWEQARKLCRQHGADLVRIDSEDEQVYYNAHRLSCIPNMWTSRTHVSSKPRRSWRQDWMKRWRSQRTSSGLVWQTLAQRAGGCGLTDHHLTRGLPLKARLNESKKIQFLYSFLSDFSQV